MATLQRRRRQGSREPAAAAEAQEPRRAHREDRRRPPLEETADQKLDRLLKEQRAARASSLPAEDDLAVRRLAMHPTAEGNESQGRRREGSLAPQPGHHGGHHDASAGQLAGAGGLMSALHDPRANALGLGGLQEAARQSFELLQQALGHHVPPSPTPGLLDPLLRGSELPQGPGSGLPHPPGGGFFGGQGSLAGTPHQPGAPHGDPRMGTPASTRQVEREEVKPRVLEPFRTPQGPLATVNPFWTTSIQQAARGEGHVRMAESAGARATNGSPGPGDVEKLRTQILKEAEEKFAREVKRITDGAGGGDASSYASVASGGVDGRGTATHPGLPHGDPSGAGGPPGSGPDPPPGLHGGQPHGEARTPLAPVVPETVRALDLPALPLPSSEGAALQFGDWLTVAYPLMADLSSTSQFWWDGCLSAARELYEQWLVATPLERLRLRPKDVTVDPLYQRVEQRGVSLLLGILPEQLRRDVISSRHVTTVSILFKLFVVFQPGGGAERTTLLKSLTEVKVGHSVTELLATMRQWRRWLQRAEELKVTLPDPLILMNVLGKIMDSLAKLGGNQVAYRVSTVRQELLVDQRPEMNSIKDLSEYLQAELEELALVAAVPKGAANTTSSPTTNEKTPVVKAMQSGTQEEKPRSPCKFWGTQHGCKRGDTCGYGHSWEGLDRQHRCFHCSGEVTWRRIVCTVNPRTSRM